MQFVPIPHKTCWYPTQVTALLQLQKDTKQIMIYCIHLQLKKALLGPKRFANWSYLPRVFRSKTNKLTMYAVCSHSAQNLSVSFAGNCPGFVEQLWDSTVQARINTGCHSNGMYNIHIIYCICNTLCTYCTLHFIHYCSFQVQYLSVCTVLFYHTRLFPRQQPPIFWEQLQDCWKLVRTQLPW